MLKNDYPVKEYPKKYKQFPSIAIPLELSRRRRYKTIALRKECSKKSTNLRSYTLPFELSMRSGVKKQLTCEKKL